MSGLTLCELADGSAWGVDSLSPFCLKIHRALKIAGLPYDRRHAANPASFKPLNPTGQVPVLVQDGQPAIPDSTAILRRILELAPGRIEAGPEHWLWEELADTALSGFVVAARWADDANWPGVRQAYFPTMPAPVRSLVGGFLRRRIVGGLHARDVWRAGPDACWRRLDGHLDHLDARAPERGFWLGDRPGVADVALWAQVQSLRTPLTPRQRAAVDARPRLVAWMDRVAAA